MFEAIRAISGKTVDFARDGQCTLENVTNVIEAYTKIDKVLFVRYEAPSDNPIWGEFLRWQQFEPYKGEVGIVEIRYASHLSLSWTRFVVCKELAHSLETGVGAGSHTVTDREVTALITELSLTSASRVNGASIAASLEKLAESGALEMLLPLEYRKELIAERGTTDKVIEEIANTHQIPQAYVRLGFNADYNALMSDMLEH